MGKLKMLEITRTVGDDERLFDVVGVVRTDDGWLDIHLKDDNVRSIRLEDVWEFDLCDLAEEKNVPTAPERTTTVKCMRFENGEPVVREYPAKTAYDIGNVIVCERDLLTMDIGLSRIANDKTVWFLPGDEEKAKQLFIDNAQRKIDYLEGIKQQAASPKEK